VEKLRKKGMIYFSRFFSIAFFLFFISSCTVISKHRLSENRRRDLATVEEPMYQIYAEDFRTADSMGPILEIFGGEFQKDRPYKILADSDCLWIKESDFQKISIRIMRLKQPLAKGYAIESRLICSVSEHQDQCEPAHYIFDGQAIQYKIKDFHTDPKSVFMKTRKATTWSPYTRCQLYEI